MGADGCTRVQTHVVYWLLGEQAEGPAAQALGRFKLGEATHERRALPAVLSALFGPFLVLLSLAVGRSPVSVGASGAIFGLLGAWAVFLQRNERFFASRGADVRGSIGSVVQTCTLNAALGMQPGARIDNMGHLGGLLGGAACSFLFGPRLRVGFSRTGVVDEPLVRLPRGPLARRRRRAARLR